MPKRFGKLKEKIESFLKYGTATIILAIPLYPKFPLFRIPGTSVAIRLEDFILLVIFALWIAVYNRNLKNIFKDKVASAILLYLAIGLVSVIAGIFLSKSVTYHIGLLHWARRVQYFVPFFVGLTSLKNKNNLHFFLKCFIVVIFFAFIYGLGQKYLSWPVITTQNEEYAKGRALRYSLHGHLVSTFAGHYDLASFVILVSPIFLSILVSKTALTNFSISKSALTSKIIIGTTLLMGLWLLVYSASRISIASYFGAMALVLILYRKYWLVPVLLVTTLIFTAFSGNLLARYARVIEVTTQKIMNSQKINSIRNFGIVYAEEEAPAPEPVEDRSSSIRLNVEWPRAIRALTKNPVLGTGYSSITLATDNDYLRLLGETGILGFLSFMLILFRLAVLLLKKIPLPKEPDLRTAYLAGLIGAIPGVLLNAVFIDIFEASKFAIIFWLLVGFAVAIVRGSDAKEN